jgi:hypothetical protein
VLGAMQNIKKKAGDLVIKEGDDGDNLYMVESGVLVCTKVFVPLMKLTNSNIERKDRAHLPEGL